MTEGEQDMSLDEEVVEEFKTNVKITLLGDDFTARLVRIEDGKGSRIAVYEKRGGDEYTLVGILTDVGVV